MVKKEAIKLRQRLTQTNARKTGYRKVRDHQGLLFVLIVSQTS